MTPHHLPVAAGRGQISDLPLTRGLGPPGPCRGRPGLITQTPTGHVISLGLIVVKLPPPWSCSQPPGGGLASQGGRSGQPRRAVRPAKEGGQPASGAISQPGGRLASQEGGQPARRTVTQPGGRSASQEGVSQPGGRSASQQGGQPARRAVSRYRSSRELLGKHDLPMLAKRECSHRQSHRYW